MSSLSPAQKGRLVLVGTILALAIFLLFSARAVLFPFVVGTFLVYLLLPAVNFLDAQMPRVLHRRHLARPLSILIIYLLLLMLLVGFFAIFIPVVSGQISELIKASGQYTMQLLSFTKGFNQALIDEWLERYNTLSPQWVRDALDSNIQQLTAFLTNAFQNFISWLGRTLQRTLMGTLEIIGSTLSFVLGIVIVPFWVFYVLNDERKITRAFYAMVPDRYRADVRNLQAIISEVLGAYIRGEILLCLFVGSMATIGLLILRVNFPLLLGTIAGILEVIPNIGPFLGAIPAILVALLRSPALALQTAILFVVIQQIENVFLVPKVAGSSVKLHPTVVMVVLVVGSAVAGVWGVVLGVPITAVARDVFRYLYLRLSDAGISPEEAIALVHPHAAIQAKGLKPTWRERLALWRAKTSQMLQSFGDLAYQIRRLIAEKAKSIMLRYQKRAQKGELEAESSYSGHEPAIHS